MAEKVVITGASAGIGRETSFQFARAGAELFLTARRRENLERIAEKCVDIGSPKVRTSVHDLSVPGEGESLVRECQAQLGGLDVLICNAGYGIFGPIDEVTPEAMERIWRVNFLSAFESIRAALPGFRKQKRGHIVLVSSIIGKKGMPYSAPYCATKFAQVGFGESLWGELRQEGIGVTVVCPGYTRTEFHDAAARTPGTDRPTRPVRGQSPKTVARAIYNGVRKNKREIHLTLSGKALLLIDRFSRHLATWVMATLAHQTRPREK